MLKLIKRLAKLETALALVYAIAVAVVALDVFVWRAVAPV